MKTMTLTLPRHAGKVEAYLANFEGLKFRSFSGEVVQAILHAIGRDEIESCNVRNLTGAFLLQRGPKQLRNSAGRCIFAVMGYGAEEEELYLIPEVREYFKGVTDLWAHWLFSSCVYFPSAIVIALCTIDNLQVFRSGNLVQITYDTEAMETFFQTCLETTAVLDSMAGISRQESVQRLVHFRQSVGLSN